MSKYLKICIASFILAALCWFTEIVINPSGFEIILAVAAIIFTIIFACFFIVSIMQRLNISPYRVFALTDSFIGLCVLIYSIYDIKTDTGWFAGLVGTLLLLFVIPIVLILLLADFFVWWYNKKKK